MRFVKSTPDWIYYSKWVKLSPADREAVNCALDLAQRRPIASKTTSTMMSSPPMP